jgi:hypothetical protein
VSFRFNFVEIHKIPFLETILVPWCGAHPTSGGFRTGRLDTATY